MVSSNERAGEVVAREGVDGDEGGLELALGLGLGSGVRVRVRVDLDLVQVTGPRQPRPYRPAHIHSLVDHPSR